MEFLTGLFGAGSSEPEDEAVTSDPASPKSITPNEEEALSPIDLPPEPQEGGTEYKLKLTDLSSFRLQQLVTQMKWRLAEGKLESA